MQQDIKNSEIRIYVNNIAGSDKHMRKIEVIINYMKINNIDIFMGQEMNITTKNTTFKKFIRRKIIREYHVVTSESNAKFASYRKPGGTFCITGPRLKNRIIERITDYMGRWAGCIYKTKKSTIAVVSVYQTVENTTHGPTSVHAQQVATLFQEGRKVTPRQAFLQDLNNVIRILQKRQIQVIIAGDFNSDVTSNNISQLMNSNVNLEVVSDPEAITSTYRLGSSCIDHVLASSTIASNITSIEYLQYPNEYYTDHTPILITLKINSKIRIPSSRYKQRRLYSKDQQNARIYIEHKHRLYAHYKISQKLDEIENELKQTTTETLMSGRIYQKINNVDNMITNMSLESERAIKARGKYKWCKEARQCQKECVNLRHQLQEAKQQGNYDNTKVIRKEISKQSNN